MSSSKTRSMKAIWLATQVTGRVSRLVSGVFASRLWFTPWPVPVSERGLAKQSKWLKVTDPMTFETRHGPVAAFSAGQGPTVVLVHGWGERAAFLGAFIEPLVESGYRVVGIDLPGHGDSGWVRTNPFELADALRDVADQLGGMNAVVAHSMGAAVSAIAIDEGLRLEAVALLAPASEMEKTFEMFGSMYALPPRALEGLRRSIDRRFGNDVWDRLRIRELASHFDIPALIVHDQDDPQVELADSHALIAAWPGARSLITSGLGHDKITREPFVIEAVTTFLDESVHRDRPRIPTASLSA